MSFLYNGMTFAILSESGNIPVARDWFMISVNGLIIAGAKVLNFFRDMPSCPAEYFVFMELIIFVTVVESTKSKWKYDIILIVRYALNGFLLISILSASLGPMLTKNELHASAIVVLFVVIVPLTEIFLILILFDLFSIRKIFCLFMPFLYCSNRLEWYSQTQGYVTPKATLDLTGYIVIWTKYIKSCISGRCGQHLRDT